MHIVYTKFFQWISLKSEYTVIDIPLSYIRGFVDNAPYVEDDIDTSALDDVCKKATECGYGLSMDDTPINSGTISLVFKGVLTTPTGNNIPVVIKVLRKDIDSKVNSTLTTIRSLLYVLRYLPVTNIISLGKTFADIEKSITDQLNFESEIENLERMERFSKLHKRLMSPHVFKEICTSRCIVMEFVQGRQLFELSREERVEFTEPFLSAILFLNQRKRTYHLDLHPGNVLFVDRGDGIKRVCLLDMGMMLTVNVERSNFMFILFRNIYCDSGDDLVDFVDKNRFSVTDSEKLTDDVMARFRRKRDTEMFLKSKDPTDIISDLTFFLNEFHRHDIPLHEDLNRLLLSLVSFLGMFISLDENRNFARLMGEKLKQL